ncbi:hypothetical protein QBC39DRAFT_77797 [Podospora conica]|nr:hypothetical protein QBC39DRAFT_77797 [Schizothecium conicum]
MPRAPSGCDDDSQSSRRCCRFRCSGVPHQRCRGLYHWHSTLPTTGVQLQFRNAVGLSRLERRWMQGTPFPTWHARLWIGHGHLSSSANEPFTITRCSGEHARWLPLGRFVLCRWVAAEAAPRFPSPSRRHDNETLASREALWGRVELGVAVLLTHMNPVPPSASGSRQLVQRVTDARDLVAAGGLQPISPSEPVTAQTLRRLHPPPCHCSSLILGTIPGTGFVWPRGQLSIYTPYRYPDVVLQTCGGCRVAFPWLLRSQSLHSTRTSSPRRRGAHTSITFDATSSTQTADIPLHLPALVTSRGLSLSTHP